MATFMQDVRDEVTALVISAITDATSTNTIQSIAAARVNLFEKIQEGDRTLPIYIVDAAVFDHDPDWSVEGDFFRCPLRVTILRHQDETDSQLVMQEELNTFRLAMDSGRTNFEVVERGSIDAGPDEESMSPILDLGLNFVAASLYYDSGILCTG
jgi:hypothetical protein